MLIVYCEFSLFVNIKYLHNIMDNKLCHASILIFFHLRREVHRENYMTFTTMQFSTKFNHNLMSCMVLGILPSLSQTGKQTDKLTNKQGNKHTN